MEPRARRATLALFGAARGFSGPAGSSLLPFLVPMEKLPKSIGWSSSAFPTAVIPRPAFCGFLYVFGPVESHTVCPACFLGAALGISNLGGPLLRGAAAN